MSGGIRLFLAVTAVAALSAQAQTKDIAYNSVEAVQAKFEIQKILQDLNARFDLLLQEPGDIERDLKFQMYFPKTQKDQEIRSYVQSQKPALEANLLKISRAEGELTSLVSRDLQEREGYNNRLFGIEINPDFPLVSGPSINEKVRIEEGEIGDLGKGVREVCFSDKSKKTDAIDFFLNTTHGLISCAQPVESAVLIEDAADALNKKIELLAGTTIPREVIEAADPTYKIDLSNAPDLKVLWMAYLEFKYDFSGLMMEQILAYHASRGTDIRILVPGLPIPSTNFVAKKDWNLLDRIEALGKNVQVKKWVFKESNPDLTTPFGMIARAQHAKVVVALGQNGSPSGTIIGGRNIKDTFYMRKTPDYTKYPEMVQYSTGEAKFGVFRDMEVLVKGEKFAEQTVAQYLSFWNFNPAGPKVIRNTAHVNVKIDQEVWDRVRNNSDQTYVRQFFSLPYVDSRAAEKIFVDMIDSAKSEIIFVNPYLSPMREINNAIVRALKRGVKIQLMTGFDLGLDNVAPFTEDMNKMAVNKFFKEYAKIKKKNPKYAKGEDLLKVHQWNEKSVIHSKIVSVDKKLLFVGSINLDQRGFTNDSENGTLIIGPPVRAFTEIFEKTYLPLSKPLVGKQKVNKMYPLLIKFLDLLNMT
jgi:cardiolipin synthase A/B